MKKGNTEVKTPAELRNAEAYALASKLVWQGAKIGYPTVVYEAYGSRVSIESPKDKAEQST